MRESVYFELRLRRFGVWQVAVGLVAAATVATVAAWAAAMWDSHAASGRMVVLAVAAALSLMTVVIAVSLARAQSGVLTCCDGVWLFAADAGMRHGGTLEVAMDLGAFLLLRLVDGRGTTLWLPVQRRGAELQWHALRCAAYSPAPRAAATPTASF